MFFKVNIQNVNILFSNIFGVFHDFLLLFVFGGGGGGGSIQTKLGRSLRRKKRNENTPHPWGPATLKARATMIYVSIPLLNWF